MTTFVPQADDGYEFRVIPAPLKADRIAGLRTDSDRMAYAWTMLLNEMADDGWDYVRADTLPNDNSADLTGTAPPTMTLLVFRRPFGLDSIVPGSPAAEHFAA